MSSAHRRSLALWLFVLTAALLTALLAGSPAGTVAAQGTATPPAMATAVWPLPDAAATPVPPPAPSPLAALPAPLLAGTQGTPVAAQGGATPPGEPTLATTGITEPADREPQQRVSVNLAVPIPEGTPDSSGVLTGSGADWVVILSENFEGVFPSGGWMLAGNPTWDDDDYRPHTGSWSAWCAKGGSKGTDPSVGYGRMVDAWMAHDFDLRGATAAQVTFWAWWDAQIGNASWCAVAGRYPYTYNCNQYTGSSGGWRQVTIDLTPYCGSSQVRVVFEFMSDYYATPNAYGGVFIDDIIVRKQAAAPPTPTRTPTPVCPGVPSLNPIANDDCDGNYLVSWTQPSGTTAATTYVLLEATSTNGPWTKVYEGANRQNQVSGRGAATYYYAVKAVNPGCDSDWSPLRSVVVCPPDATPPVITNVTRSAEAIDKAGCPGTTTVTIQATVTDNRGVSQVWLRYMPPGQAWTQATMAAAGGGAYRVTIGPFASAGTLTYEVHAKDAANNESQSAQGTVAVEDCPLPAPTLQPISNPDCDGAYRLSWNSVAGATRYDVQEADNPQMANGRTVGQTASTTMDISGKAPGTYYYRVGACNAVTCSYWGNIQSVRVWPLPARPTMWTAINTDCAGSYDVGWDAVADATHYELQVDDTEGFSSPTPVSSPTSPSARVQGQAPGVYYYRVRACNCRGCGEYSVPRKVVVLGAPVLQPIDNDDCDGSFALNWTAVPGATGYTVEQSRYDDFSQADTLPAGNRLTLTCTPPPASYFYRVRATTATCSGPWSNVWWATVWEIPPAPVLNPIDNSDGDASYSLSWSDIPANRYELQEADNPAFNNAKVVYDGPSTAGGFGNHAGGTWYYRVRGCNCRGCGPWSAAQSVVVPQAPTVQGVTAALDGDRSAAIGYFVSLPNMGVPVWNTFTAQVATGSNAIARVDWTLANLTWSDTTPQDGFTFSCDMSQLPAGDVLLRVVAYDQRGLVSPPLLVTVHMVAPPPWFGKAWVLNSRAGYAPQEYRYHFTGKVPNNPRLFYQYSVSLRFFGQLRNTFESDVDVWETFRLDGLWTYQGEGVLAAELMGVSLVQQRYGAQPLLLRGGAPGWHASDGYQWSRTWEYGGARIPVVPRLAFVLPPPLPPLEVAASVDMGFDSALTLSGRLHSDLRPDEIRISPAVDAHAQVDVGLECLGGMFGQGLGVRPEVGIGMPVVYDLTPPAGQSTIYLDRPCVSFRLVGNVYTRVFWKKIHYGNVTVYSDQWPSGCRAQGADAASIAAAEPPVDLFLAPSVAADGRGGALAVWVTDKDASPDVVNPEVQYARWTGSAWTAPANLTSNDRYETDPVVVFLSTGKALAVWTQNEIPRAQADAISDLDAVLAEQELYSSVWDGSRWSAPVRFTNDHLPDGKAAVAGGPSGQAIALWVRDGDGQAATQGDQSIYGSLWNGQSWSTPGALAAHPQAAESAPQVAFAASGQAMAVWVHDGDASAATPGDRYLAHAVWNGSGWEATELRTDWPAGALNPRVAYSAAQEPLLVFTVREKDPQGEYYGEGTHDLLWSARRTASGWQVAPVGPRTVAHEPRLGISSANQAVVAFRGFQGQGVDGFSGDVMVTTADLNQAGLSWSPPQFQSKDSARDWQIGAAVEPVSGRTLVLNQHTPLAGQASGMVTEQSWVSAVALQGDLRALDVPFGTDLTLTAADIKVSNAHPQAGEEVVITATVRNAGLKAAGSAFHVVFRRSSPSQVIADVVVAAPLGHNEAREVVARWTAPGGANEIVVVVDSTGAVAELDEGNNQASLSLGQTPPPQFLVAAPAPAGRAILLAWQPPDTQGITAYRLYRATAAGGTYARLTETTDTGYLDPDCTPGTVFYYVVTAVDSHGVESVRSNVASAAAGVPLTERARLPIVFKDIHTTPGPAPTPTVAPTPTMTPSAPAGPKQVLWAEIFWTGRTLSFDRALEIDPEHPDWKFCGRLRDDLADEFTLDRRTDGPLTPQLLAGYDAVIFPDPYAHLSDDERQALEQFAAAGGGVLWLGGSGPAASEVFQDKGITYNNNVLFDSRNDGDFEAASFAAHPAVAGVSRFVTNWGGSVEAVPPAVALAASPAEVYRDDNGNLAYDVGEPTGPFTLAAASQVGAGRWALVSGAPVQDHAYDYRANTPLIRALLRWVTGPR